MNKRNQYRLINWLKGDWAVAALRLSRWNDINRAEVRDLRWRLKCAGEENERLIGTLTAERKAHAEAIAELCEALIEIRDGPWMNTRDARDIARAVLDKHGKED